MSCGYKFLWKTINFLFNDSIDSKGLQMKKYVVFYRRTLTHTCPTSITFYLFDVFAFDCDDEVAFIIYFKII